ncbi:MAG: LysR family transcriptional regulator [Solirubrobacterales bacterium]|nr:LysR family transcriptional regulator [Solirubrobacterales bacterium]
MIEYRHLRYFVAVAEERNFSRAAERLYMAQPPLSAAIRQLEQDLGVELLRRSTREVTLTEAGEAFLEGAHTTLAILERTVGDVRRIGNGGLRQLHAGVGCPAHVHTFPTICEAFRGTHPDIAVVGEQMWNAQIPEALRRGTVDVALTSCPEFDRELSTRTIRREQLFVLVSKDHPAADQSTVSLRELASSEFLCPPATLAPTFHQTFIAMCQAAGFDPIISRHSLMSGWETGLVLATDSVKLAAESFASTRPDGVVALALSPRAYLDTVVVWRTDDPPTAALAFAELATTVFAQTLDTLVVSA